MRGDVGVDGHIRGTYYPPYGLALDQRPDEIHSLAFDWPVIDDLEILGNPVLELAFRSTPSRRIRRRAALARCSPTARRCS